MKKKNTNSRNKVTFTKAGITITKTTKTQQKKMQHQSEQPDQETDRGLYSEQSTDELQLWKQVSGIELMRWAWPAGEWNGKQSVDY